MTLDEYQELAFKTCTKSSYCDEYLDLGYLAEVGELAGKLAKRVRGDVVDDMQIMHEIGDIAWFIAIKARLNGKQITLCPLVPYYHGTVFDLLTPANNSHNLKMSILKNICDKLGSSFWECLQLNIDKLSSRQDRGTIIGSGDNR